MGETSGKMTKLAWKRNPDVPAGQPALGTFSCVCGATIAEVEFGGPVSTCPGCGRTWDGHGWLKRDPREHVSGAGALHPDCLYGGTEGAPCRSHEDFPAGLKATPQGAGLLGYPQGGAA